MRCCRDCDYHGPTRIAAVDNLEIAFGSGMIEM